MTKRMIEVDDVLPECVESAVNEVESLLRRYMKDEKPSVVPCLSNDLDYSGAVHEIIDGAVPIYTSQIEAAWFLHGGALEDAYQNAGVGENPRQNNGMAAIYYYIQEKVAEWYDKNAEDVCEEIWNAICPSDE